MNPAGSYGKPVKANNCSRSPLDMGFQFAWSSPELLTSANIDSRKAALRLRVRSNDFLFCEHLMRIYLRF